MLLNLVKLYLPGALSAAVLVGLAGAAAPKQEKKDLRPKDPVGELFELGHKFTKSVDDLGQAKLGLSEDEEIKVGREMHKLLRKELPLVQPPRFVDRMKRLALPILEQRTRTGLKYAFWVIDKPEVNAFAHAGGYVYVNKGLFSFVKGDAELQFILAHEIGHIDLKHMSKRITYSARAAELGGESGRMLAQAAYMAVATGYTKEEEFAADAYAMHAMLKIGRSRDECLAAMRHLLADVKRKKHEPPRGVPKDNSEKVVRQVEDHFRSHPPTEERLRRLESLE
jgi:predicted Zn-dependent protease